MLKSLPFGRRKSLTLKRVSRQLRGPHYIVQSIALSTRNFATISRLPPFAPIAIVSISRCASTVYVGISYSAPTERFSSNPFLAAGR